MTFSPCWKVSQFSEAAGRMISILTSEAMILCWKMVGCSLWVGEELLPQDREYLGGLDHV